MPPMLESLSALYVCSFQSAIHSPFQLSKTSQSRQLMKEILIIRCMHFSSIKFLAEMRRRNETQMDGASSVLSGTCYLMMMEFY